MASAWIYIGGIFGGYIITSYILLKFPNILHKKKVYKSKVLRDVLERKGVLHISHRGGTDY